ncbi:hypothetical protein [Enterobacter sp. PTB]|uniref:hypothetical protein n=1 Tax=Enterobacter sp. PTB TaxID=3143437 RepID=UPI003DA9C382
MSRLTELTPMEKRFLDDAVAEAERVAGKKLNQPQRRIVLNQARAQIESARYAAKMQAARAESRQDAQFTWSKPKPFRR